LADVAYCLAGNDRFQSENRACVGFLSQLAEARGVITAETRLLVFVGVLGGFTTFSSFGNETLNLSRDG